MNLKKKFCIGFSLNLDSYEWYELFREYGDYIYEIYFTPPIDDKRLHIHPDVQKQLKDTKYANFKTTQMIKIAKEHGIRVNMVLNTKKSSDVEVVWLAKDWCVKNNIKPDTLTVMDHLYMDALLAFDVDTEFTYSYNNNIKDSKFLERCDGNYEYVEIGNRSLRNIEIFNAINDDGGEIEVILNNGCSHNCSWCSSKKNNCKDVIDRNIEKYGLLHLMALQSVYPFEMRDYYDNITIKTRQSTTYEDKKGHTVWRNEVVELHMSASLYKLNTIRYSNYWDFKKTLNLYINNINPTSIQEFYHTCVLDELLEYVDKYEFSKKDWNEIMKIKKSLWKDALENCGV